MDERIDLFLQGKMSKIEADEFREQLKNDDTLRDRAITMAILLKSMKKAGAERDQEFINEIYDSRIDSYLKGKMNQDEISEFKLQLERNEELRNRTVSKAIFLKTLKKVGKEKDQEVINDLKKTVHKESNNSVSLFIRYTIAIAACICILFSVDYHLAKNETITLGTEYLAYAPTLDTDDQYRGSLDDRNINLELDSIFTNVRSSKDIKNNIQKLTSLCGIAKSEIVNDYTDYLDYIGYYLAISYLQNNERNKAEEVLSDLLEYSPNFREAKKLLDRIKEVKGLW